jgi:hypothetical protein
VMPKFNWAMLLVKSILIISEQLPLFVYILLLLLWNVWWPTVNNWQFGLNLDKFEMILKWNCLLLFLNTAAALLSSYSSTTYVHCSCKYMQFGYSYCLLVHCSCTILATLVLVDTCIPPPSILCVLATCIYYYYSSTPTTVYYCYWYILLLLIYSYNYVLLHWYILLLLIYSYNYILVLLSSTTTPPPIYYCSYILLLLVLYSY